MAKIAVDLQRALQNRAESGSPGQATARRLAQGSGWTVDDVVCTSGPGDRPFEEQHTQVSIAVVVAGTFQYRSAAGRELMTPGSLLLGNPGQFFECGHDHGAGDRCLSFRYAPEYFERLAAAAGASGGLQFRTLKVPPLRELSPAVARACTGLTRGGTAAAPDAAPWEEISVEVAARAVQLASGRVSDAVSAPPHAEARIARSVRTIERHLDSPLGLDPLARQAGLNVYHFLRTFQRVTGVTPHQYLLRARLREAAMRLTAERARVIDIALDCGFGDLSNFTRAFRTEFGVSPRRYLRGPAEPVVVGDTRSPA